MSEGIFPVGAVVVSLSSPCKAPGLAMIYEFTKSDDRWGWGVGGYTCGKINIGCHLIPQKTGSCNFSERGL